MNSDISHKESETWFTLGLFVLMFAGCVALFLFVTEEEGKAPKL